MIILDDDRVSPEDEFLWRQTLATRLEAGSIEGFDSSGNRIAYGSMTDARRRGLMSYSISPTEAFREVFQQFYRIQQGQLDFDVALIQNTHTHPPVALDRGGPDFANADLNVMFLHLAMLEALGLGGVTTSYSVLGLRAGVLAKRTIVIPGGSLSFVRGDYTPGPMRELIARISYALWAEENGLPAGFRFSPRL